MYKFALYLFRIYWVPILLASVALFLLDIWGQGSIARSFAPTLLLYGYLAFLFHFTLLTGTTISVFQTSSQPPSPNWSFWTAYSLPVVFIFFAMAVIFFTVKATFSDHTLPVDTAFGYTIIISAPLFGIVLSAVGTMIPAAAIGTSTGVRAALKRTRKSFWFILWRLVAGPTVFSLAFVGLAITLDQQGLASPVPETFSGITISNTIYQTAHGFLGIFNTALTASIFSMAYTRVEEGRSLQLST